MLKTILFSMFGLRLPHNFFESAGAYALKNSRRISDERRTRQLPRFKRDGIRSMPRFGSEPNRLQGLDSGLRRVRPCKTGENHGRKQVPAYFANKNSKKITDIFFHSKSLFSPILNWNAFSYFFAKILLLLKKNRDIFIKTQLRRPIWQSKNNSYR